jgi:hypothetical protein
MSSSVTIKVNIKVENGTAGEKLPKPILTVLQATK